MDDPERLSFWLQLPKAGLLACTNTVPALCGAENKPRGSCVLSQPQATDQAKPAAGHWPGGLLTYSSLVVLALLLLLWAGVPQAKGEI